MIGLQMRGHTKPSMVYPRSLIFRIRNHQTRYGYTKLPYTLSPPYWQLASIGPSLSERAYLTC